MVTIYDLLEVQEDASMDEIKSAYENMIEQYRIDENNSEEVNKENMIILNKLKMAYNILSIPEKRKKYDNDLAKKRAEELLKSVGDNSALKEETKKVQNNITNNINTSAELNTKKVEENSNIKSQQTTTNSNQYNDSQYYDNDIETESELSDEERKKVRHAAEEEFKKKLRKVQEAEEEYKKAYNKAYQNYIKSAETKSRKLETIKEKFKKILITIITILVIILICWIAWLIPAVRAPFLEIYNSSPIIKGLIDVIIGIVKSILGIFKFW